MSLKVSVVIPVKKIDSYFHIALHSIIDQTYENIEIIIVVDQSYEKEMFDAINAPAYKENNQNIRIVSSNMSGIAAALNMGIQETRGVYIARMDSDDISEPTRIEKQINYFRLNSSCKVLGSRAKYINEDGNIIGISPKIPRNKNIYKSMYFNNILIHPSAMIDAEFIKKLGGYSNQPSEDYELWLRCLELDIKSLAILDEELIYYRLHKNQISRLTRAKGQISVCSSLFSAMTRNMNFYILIGFVYNFLKLIFRKIQNLV